LAEEWNFSKLVWYMNMVVEFYHLKSADLQEKVLGLLFKGRCRRIQFYPIKLQVLEYLETNRK